MTIPALPGDPYDPLNLDEDTTNKLRTRIHTLTATIQKGEEAKKEQDEIFDSTLNLPSQSNFVQELCTKPISWEDTVCNSGYDETIPSKYISGLLTDIDNTNKSLLQQVGKPGVESYIPILQNILLTIFVHTSIPWAVSKRKVGDLEKRLSDNVVRLDKLIDLLGCREYVPAIYLNSLRILCESSSPTVKNDSALMDGHALSGDKNLVNKMMKDLNGKSKYEKVDMIMTDYTSVDFDKSYHGVIVGGGKLNMSNVFDGLYCDDMIGGVYTDEISDRVKKMRKKHSLDELLDSEENISRFLQKKKEVLQVMQLEETQRI